MFFRGFVTPHSVTRSQNPTPAQRRYIADDFGFARKSDNFQATRGLRLESCLVMQQTNSDIKNGNAISRSRTLPLSSLDFLYEIRSCRSLGEKAS